MPRQRIRALGNVCGLSGPHLVVLKSGFDGFFRDKGSGMGGETQKCDLRVRLAVFQILKN